MRLSGKIALVTGAGSGIGQAAAKLFALEGATLALNDIASLNRTTALVAEAGGRFSEHLADVADSSVVERMVSDVVARWGRLDVVVANAGINRDGFVTNLTDEDWNQVMAVNLTGCFNVCRAAFRKLSSPGTVVATSSVSALGNLGQVNYAASKAGLIGLTRSLCLEGASKGIRVNAVAPGFTDTEMVRSIPERVRGKLLERVPLGRLATPEEIARAMLFLACEDSSYITGQTLFVDGGASVGI